ncbi:hypothetical protein BDZ89DRAFT_486000 [Hymenopellis radicata]|nr:hypothetical protein BDZ89DRAFT_486000 [Hymenopellis radicata]
MESRTLVWGKSVSLQPKPVLRYRRHGLTASNPWYPGIVIFDEDIRRDNLRVPIPVSAKFEEKRLKTPYLPHFIVRFFDNNWACVPLSNLKMLGEIPELDRDMVAADSQFQGKWTGKRHAEIKNAFNLAMYSIGSDSE